MTELPEHVPVGAAGRKRERSPGGDAVQAALGIERIQQREEVVLVGASPVEEDERAFGLAGRRPRSKPKLAQGAACGAAFRIRGLCPRIRLN